MELREPQTVIITGGASGIGLGTAERLVSTGLRVVLLDVRRTALEAAVAELGDAARGIECDVMSEESVRGAFDYAAAHAPNLRGVVVSAGIQLFGSDSAIQDLDRAVFDRTHAANVRGAVLAGKYGARALIAGDQGGSIVLIGSPTGLVGQAPDFAAYSTSKSAIFGLSRVMASSLARFRIRVNVVVPGFTETPLVGPIIDSPDAVERLVSRIPLGRAARAMDIAPMIEFLVSESSSYSTGAVFTVDGGMLAV